jgi:hypothetical protein
MAFDLTDLLNGVGDSRRFFLRHLDGLSDSQWTWKPYAECKSVQATVIHVIANDRMAAQKLETGRDPDDFEAFYGSVSDELAGESGQSLVDLARSSHEALRRVIERKYSAAPLDTEVRLWGPPRKLGAVVAYLSSEDYYHAGQVAFIRIATDPEWDYYGSIYGA